MKKAKASSVIAHLVLFLFCLFCIFPVLLLVIEGRQTSSLGATYQDCIDIMMQHGAINAANLDGGGCSTMVYQGETLTSSVSVLGKDRKVPTAWIVK